MKINIYCLITKFTKHITVLLAALAVICCDDEGHMSSATALPTIASVTGSFSNGNSFTVNGSGFGSGPKVFLFDDFENGVIGEKLRLGANSAVIGQWDVVGTLPPKYSSRSAHSGTKAFEAMQSPTVEGGNFAQVLLPSVTEIFMSWWNFVPTDTPWPGELAGGATNPNGPINWKIMWIAGDQYFNYNDQDFVMISNPKYFYITGNNAVWGTPDFFVIDDFPKGEWKRFWWWQKDGAASNGNVNLWELRNPTALSPGVKKLINANYVSTTIAGRTRTRLSVNAYTRQNSTGVQPVQMFDDVYVAVGPNSQARVEVGNAATYASCTNLSVATSTSWTDTQITATFRSGSFKSGENAYLFVIDGSGNVSTGKTIVIGAQSQIAPPTGLKVIP